MASYTSPYFCGNSKAALFMKCALTNIFNWKLCDALSPRVRDDQMFVLCYCYMKKKLKL